VRIPLALLVLGTAPIQAVAQQRSGSFQTHIAKKTTLQYLLYLPQSYSAANKWPLIVYLHGGSARGDDVNKIRESVVDDPDRFAAIAPMRALSPVATPLCPA